MSLTGQLKGPGPLRAWFEESFPNTRSLATYANRFLCGPSNNPGHCILPPLGSDRALVGTAVDYLLRASISESAWKGCVAFYGAANLDRAFLTNKGAAINAVEEIISFTERVGPWRKPPSGAEWSDLCARCLVLAKFEQCYRSPMGVADMVPRLSRSAQNVEAFIQGIVDFRSLSDLEDLGRAAASDHRDLQRCNRMYLNPTFDQSRALGGADADLIVDGLLLDLKSSSTRRVVRRYELWQLLGYVLADSSDSYAIGEVGLSALRWRQRFVISVADLARELSGGLERELEVWREIFSAVVNDRTKRRPLL